MEEFLTFYDILDVKSNASPEKIKEAYHIMAKKYHPDIAAPENKSAYEEKFKKINEAYTVLSDEKSRKEYNKKIKTLEKEHWKKLIQDTQIQIQQLQQQLTKYLKESAFSYCQTKYCHGNHCCRRLLYNASLYG